jgi:maltooligosyltrehalose trehalohydrolase
MVAPFLPMLFMGEEWSELHPFLYFVSHTDPELAEAVRKGRREEFAAFHIQGDAPDPMSEETFFQSKIQWHLIKEGQHKIMLCYYKTLIQLRKKQSALSTPNRKQLQVIADKEKNLLMLYRWQGEEHIFCFMNFSRKQQMMLLPTEKALHKLFDSSEREWNGPGDMPFTNEIKSGNQLIGLQPESISIFISHV